MRKIIGVAALLILFLYFLQILNYFLVDEVVALYFFPIILVALVATIIYLIIRIFKRISYPKLILNAFFVAFAMQITILVLILRMVSLQYFDRKQVVDDIDYAIRVMEDVHPNLYTKIDKKRFYLKVDSVKKTLPLEISNIEANRIFRKIVNPIRDAHTGVGVGIFRNIFSLIIKKNLPYTFELIKDKLYVAKNNTTRDIIPVGSEILKINGKPTTQCISEISQLLSYESLPIRDSQLQYSFYWSYWNDYNAFEITYITPDRKTIKTVSTSQDIISKLLMIREKNRQKCDYSFKILYGKVGYLEFNAFNDVDKFKLFLDSTFRFIKSQNVDKLIIDIRKNGGGNTILGDELMQYISNTEYCMFDSARVKISQQLIDRKTFGWEALAKHKIGTVLNDTSDTSKRRLRENPLRFFGQSYLLISGATFSSASNFAGSFKCNHLGKIIGTETGGLTACFGEVYAYELPNTKTDMRVSCKEYFNACGVADGHGVIPDYLVENSVDDLKSSNDMVLDFTMNLIEKQ